MKNFKRLISVVLAALFILALAIPAFAEDTVINEVEIEIRCRHGVKTSNYSKWVKCSTPGVKIVSVELKNEEITNKATTDKAIGGLDYDIEIKIEAEEGYTFDSAAKVKIYDNSPSEGGSYYEETLGKTILTNVTCCGGIFAETLLRSLYLLFFKWFGK